MSYSPVFSSIVDKMKRATVVGWRETRPNSKPCSIGIATTDGNEWKISRGKSPALSRSNNLPLVQAVYDRWPSRLPADLIGRVGVRL